MTYDIIIAGAGASGLMAMRELLSSGYQVCIMEASDIAGGRIASVKECGFHSTIETGAEFVHGKLPLTLELLNAAAINYQAVGGEMINATDEQWHFNQAHDIHWGKFMQQLGELQNDVSMQQFLTDNFYSDEYKDLRQAVKHYAEGFDLANLEMASAIALRDEWNHEEEEQFRLPGGYSQLVEFLLNACDQPNASFLFNTAVEKIVYNDSLVSVYTNSGQVFYAHKLILTVSAGILQSGLIEFAPALNKDYQQAIGYLGFGNVIKIIIQFKTAFWKKDSDNIGFLFSNEAIPTWWTRAPTEENILTGWLGGPSSVEMEKQTPEEIFQSSLQSLAAIFHTTQKALQVQVDAYKVIDWQRKPFIKGGYSFNTIHSAVAKQRLLIPIENKIYFAGEALYEGKWQGTVEAALQNGKSTALLVKNSLK